MSSIRLSGDIEWSSFELRINLDKLHKEFKELFGDLCLITDVVFDLGFGKSGSNRLVHVQHIGFAIPRVSVILKGQVIVDAERSIFVENSEFGGTAWTSGEPDGERVFRFIGSGSKEPVEQIVVFVQTDEAWLMVFIQKEVFFG